MIMNSIVPHQIDQRCFQIVTRLRCFGLAPVGYYDFGSASLRGFHFEKGCLPAVRPNFIIATANKLLDRKGPNGNKASI